MSLLSAQNIFFGYDELPILKKISLSLRDGEKVALVGKNGSGKTTLSLVLAGIFKPLSGSVQIDGVSFWNGDENALIQQNIGYVFQNPEDGFVASDIFREIAFAAENFAILRDEILARIKELLAQFEFDTGKSRLELSGGMKARLAIASALATGAKFLILDEPESFLDLRGQRALKDILSADFTGSGILHITRTAEIAQNCDSVYVIEDGTLRIAEDSDFQPLPDIKIESINGGEVVNKFDDVSFGYNGDAVLKNVSFDIRRGEVVGLVGASGCGKTTLALLCAGILKQSNGFIERNGRISVALQFPERQLFADTVMDDVMFGPKNFGIKNAESISQNALEMLGVSAELWENSPFLLSDGQQRRVGLAGVIAVQPDLLILDEPFASLDNDGISRVLNLIAKLAKDGTAIIVITHRTDIIAKIAHRTIALLNGKIEYDGDTKILLNNIELCEQIGVRANIQIV